MAPPGPLCVMTGAMLTPPPAPEFIEAEPPKQSFRARLGAKFKSILEWMRERLFTFLRQ
jgi:hypothetical protein